MLRPLTRLEKMPARCKSFDRVAKYFFRYSEIGNDQLRDSLAGTQD
jgi:hypothetical protein